MSGRFAVPEGSPEIRKLHPADFGGVQVHRLTSGEIPHRLCCMAGCGAAGAVQVWGSPLRMGGLRIVCRKHLVRLALGWFIMLGMPDAILSAQTVAKALQVEWDVVAAVDPKLACAPTSWSCAECGGGMIPTAAGQVNGSRWAGKEYYHRCGD